MIIRKYPLLLCALILTLSCISCEESSDSDAPGTTGGDSSGDDGGEGPTIGSLAISDNELAAAYPEGMAMTTFPQAIDTTPGEAAPGTLAIETGSLRLSSHPQENQNIQGGSNVSFSKHPKETLEEKAEILSGEANECFVGDSIAALMGPANVTDFCFGFDYGIVSGTVMGKGDQGQVNPALQGVTSIEEAKANLEAKVTQADTTNEACMVGTARLLVEGAIGRVEGILNLMEGMLCQTKKDSLADALPEVGESIDLIDAFDGVGADGPNPSTFTSAKITRLEDKNERAVFQSTITVELDQGGSTQPFELNMVHSPGAESNETYDGIIWMKGKRQDDQNNKTYNEVVSVHYSKTGTTFEDSNLKFEVRNASKVEEHEPFFSSGIVDYNSGAGSNGSFGTNNDNDFIENIKYFAFDVNPSNYAGKISFWVNPGGNYQEAARGFVFETAQETDGKLKGCAYAGALREGSIRKALADNKSLKPTGCYTPQLSNGVCGTSNDNQGNEVWVQCFKQNDNGYYVIDTDNITDDSTGFDVKQASSVTVPDIDFSSLQEFDNIISE